MDLWIRSQNKMTLSKARDLRLFKIADEWHIRAIWNDDINPCAEYSTKEKALKVLDKIQNLLIDRYVVNKECYLGSDVFMPSKDAEIKILPKTCVVYQMPADDEVK